jgi:HlyD family secretion protein
MAKRLPGPSRDAHMAPMKTTVAVLVLLGVAGGGAAYYANHRTPESTTNLATVAVKQGDLLSTIGATGTVEPEDVVNVGARVAGLIVAFGKDPREPGKSVDFGTTVNEGDLLAEIDPIPYDIAWEQAKSTLEQSRAALAQYVAKLKQAENEQKRAESLLAQKAIADTDYDTTLYNYESAKASVALGEATVHQDEQAVRLAKVNRDYCTIKSPVRGTIIDRRVNIGQTVVAALNAPSLFLIAKDLTRMQVWASVNEADIGRIRLDMPVHFTVDAHDGQIFYGNVTQIRMNAQMTQNVVTYTVIVTTDNSDGRLLPYLTANVQFEVDKRSRVLLVPNAALRWTPETDQIDPTVDATALADPAAKSQEHACLWVLTPNGRVRPAEVAVGATDGTMTEISGPSVKEGMRVVAGEEGDEESAAPQGGATTDESKTSNPFLPKPPKGSRPPPGPM